MPVSLRMPVFFHIDKKLWKKVLTNHYLYCRIMKPSGVIPDIVRSKKNYKKGIDKQYNLMYND